MLVSESASFNVSYTKVHTNTRLCCCRDRHTVNDNGKNAEKNKLKTSLFIIIIITIIIIVHKKRLMASNKSILTTKPLCHESENIKVFYCISWGPMSSFDSPFQMRAAKPNSVFNNISDF